MINVQRGLQVLDVVGLPLFSCFALDQVMVSSSLHCFLTEQRLSAGLRIFSCPSSCSLLSHINAQADASPRETENRYALARAALPVSLGVNGWDFGL